MPFLHRLKPLEIHRNVRHRVTAHTSATPHEAPEVHATACFSHDALDAALRQHWAEQSLPGLLGKTRIDQEEHGWALHGSWEAPRIRLDFHHTDQRAWLVLEL